MPNQNTPSVGITGGMREDLSPHMAPPGTLVAARNVRFAYAGEAQARPGTQALAIATSADVPYASVAGTEGPDFIAPVPGGFVFGAQGYGYRYDFLKSRVFADGSYANAVPKGIFATIASEEVSVAAGFSTPYPTSVAIGNGYVAICWSAGSGVDSIGGTGSPRFKVQIFTEGGALVTTYTTTTYTAGWVLFDQDAVAGGAFVIIGQNATAIDAALVTLQSSGAVVGSFANVATLTATASYWAAASFPGIGWALVYQSAALVARVITLAGNTPLGPNVTFAVTGIRPLSIFCDATNAWVGYVNVGANNDSFMRVYNTALAAVGGASLVYTIAGAGLSLTPPLFCSGVTAGTVFGVVGYTFNRGFSAVEPGGYTIAFGADQSGAITGTGGRFASGIPSSAPFNRSMIWVRCRVGEDATHGNSYVRHALLDFMSDRVTDSDDKFQYPRVALLGDVFADPQGGSYLGGAYLMHLCAPQRFHANGQETNDWIAALPRLIRSEVKAGAYSGLAIGEWLKFETESRRQTKIHGSDVVVPGSPTVVGNNVTATVHYGISPATERQAFGTDLGFPLPSVAATLVESVGAGALTALGAYQCRLVLEWIGPDSKRYRSAPSRIYSKTLTGGNNTLTHNGPEFYGWLRQSINDYIPSGVVVHVYRTLAGGTSFQRATPAQGAPIAPGNTLAFVDTISDADLQTREILYTDGGVLDNEPAPSCQFLALGEDRMWTAGLWDLKRARSSKIEVPGEPLQFTESPAFDVVTPTDLTGLATQDGTTVLFSKSAIYGVQGGGPTDQGQGAWDSPRLVTRSTGCVNGISVLETSAGILFESARGIELLPRGLGEPQFVGEPIQRSLAASGEHVTGCAVITTRETRTARFCNGTTEVFVLDLDSGAWSIDEYPAAVTAICDTEEGAVLALATPSAGGFGFLLESELLQSDAVGDVAAPVESELTWAAVRPFGTAGWGRFNKATCMFDELAPGYVAGADCTLFATVDTQTDPGGAFDMGDFQSPAYRQRVPANQDGVAISLRVTTEAAGWRCMGWTLDIDDHGGSRRMPSEERA